MHAMSTVDLSPRARRALDAICDTFAPGGAGSPSATDIGVPDTLLELVGRNPRAAGAQAGLRGRRRWPDAVLPLSGPLDPPENLRPALSQRGWHGLTRRQHRPARRFLPRCEKPDSSLPSKSFSQ